MPPYCFRLEKSSGFCHPASIPTRPSFLVCHNWRQISGVLDEHMALYGIAEVPSRFIDTGQRRRVSFSGCSVFNARSIFALGDRSAVNLLAQTPIGPSQGILST